jgi:hypothetical protein
MEVRVHRNEMNARSSSLGSRYLHEDILASSYNNSVPEDLQQDRVALAYLSPEGPPVLVYDRDENSFARSRFTAFRQFQG